MYTQIQSKYYNFDQYSLDATDAKLADTAVHLFGNRFLYDNVSLLLYYFNGQYWKVDKTKHYLSLAIQMELSQFFKMGSDHYNTKMQKIIFDNVDVQFNQKSKI